MYYGNIPYMFDYWDNVVVLFLLKSYHTYAKSYQTSRSQMVKKWTMNLVKVGLQCAQKKSPNVYKNCPKMILLEKW